jgi:hypothetical protein
MPESCRWPGAAAEPVLRVCDGGKWWKAVSLHSDETLEERTRATLQVGTALTIGQKVCLVQRPGRSAKPLHYLLQVYFSRIATLASNDLAMRKPRKVVRADLGNQLRSAERRPLEP